jgi:hypothetical protein
MNLSIPKVRSADAIQAKTPIIKMVSELNGIIPSIPVILVIHWSTADNKGPDETNRIPNGITSQTKGQRFKKSLNFFIAISSLIFSSMVLVSIAS